MSDGVAQPILVGVLRPLILLPAAALAGWTPEQLDMVLLHELAHVRRRDNLVNLLQRIVESLLFYHPAVWLVSRQVRRDREECCDAAVIRHTDRPHQYAELLVSIAAALRGGPAPSLAVASAMASHPLAGRIRRILNIEEEPMRITRRTLAATLLLPALLAGAMLYSGANAEDAQNPPPSQEQPSTVASGERAQGGSLDAGGIPDANHPNTPASDDNETNDDLKEATADTAPTDIVEGVAIVTYPIDNLPANIDLREWMELVASDPRIEFQWRPQEKGLLIAAPKTVHDELHELLETARKLSQLAPPRPAPAPQSADQLWNSQSGNNAWNGVATTPPNSNKLFNEPSQSQIEIPQLQTAIRNLEAIVTKSQEELVNFEVYDQIVGPNGRDANRLQMAIAKELDQDPTITKYRQQQIEIQTKLQEMLSASKNPNAPEIKRLRTTIQKAQAEFEKYRREAERTLHDKLKKLPKTPEELAAEREYEIRRKVAEENVAKYQEQLAAARARLSKLGAAQPAPIPQPTIPPTTYRAGDFPTIREFPANADMKEVNAAVDKLKAEGRQVAIEQNVDGRKRIVDTAVRASDAWNNSDPPGKASVADNPVPRLGTNPDAGLQEIVVHFPPGVPNTAEDCNRIRQELKAQGFESEPTQLKYMEATKSGKIEERFEICLRVSVPKDWQAKPVWETKIDASGTPRAALRLINEPTIPAHSPADPATPPVPSSSSYSAPPIQAPEQPASPALTANESPTIAQIKEAFVIRPGNPEVTRQYEVIPSMREGMADVFDKLSTNPRGPRVTVKWKWIDDHTRLEVIAPEEAHRLLFDKPLSGELVDLLHKPSSPFPTLENQKIADRAYKLLSLELEPADGEDLERIKKLGYSGGLRITASHQRTANIVEGDLLVGLHVWPITDLKSLDEVLQRDDLGELNPLKHYVIRNMPDRAALGGGGGFGGGPMKDAVVTGRLQIPEAELLSRGLEQTNQAMSQLAANPPTAGDLSPYPDNISGGPGSPNQGGAATGSNPDDAPPNAQASSGFAAPVQEPEPPASPFSGESTYLYDGKTFEQWRDLWKLELNPERRTEAINALAAFGRTGHGQEAADAILAVAGEYSDKYGNGSPEGKLLLAVLTAVSRMPAEQWMPQVQQRIAAANEPEKAIWIGHAARFLGASDDRSDDGRRHAAKFADLASDELVTATALYLLRSDPGLTHPETVDLLRRAFQQKSPGISVLSLGFRHLDKVPEQLDLLVRDAGIRSALNTRIANDKEMAARLYPPLLEMLKDPNRAEDRIGVLRALRVIGPVIRSNEPLENRRQITDELTELLRTGPDELLPAVFVTFSKYWGSSNYDEIRASLLEQGQLTAERIKHLRELELAIYKEASAP